MTDNIDHDDDIITIDLSELEPRADDAPEGVKLRVPRSDWDEFDVAGFIASGAPDEPDAAFVTRTDGAKLLYKGKVHSIAGEPESGKGWFACNAAADILRTTDEHVLYIDFEDSAISIVRRMVDVGADRADIRARFHVIAPESGLPEKGTERWKHFVQALTSALDQGSKYALVILDGVTQAISNQSADSNSNDEVARWFRELPRMFTKNKKLVARGQSSAVLMVDHVVKSQGDRGRYAIGAGTKLAAIDGCQFMAEVKIPFSRSQQGLVRIIVTKDRPGHVRAVAAGIQHAQAVCDMRLTPGDDGALQVTLHKPDLESKDDGTVKTGALQRAVYQYLKKSKDGRRRQDIIAGVKGRTQTIEAAINDLYDEGVIAKTTSGRTVLYYLPDDNGNDSTNTSVEVTD